MVDPDLPLVDGGIVDDEPLHQDATIGVRTQPDRDATPVSVPVLACTRPRAGFVSGWS